MLSTPVAFFIFNRPQVTARVFAEIARARPARLFIVADGPRPDRPGEAALCQQTRDVVAHVDWDCQVYRNYSDVNLGCGLRVSSGIDWVFGQVEESIFLEDDCLPDPTFFRFCDTLLDHYRNDDRIMMVCGTNWLCEWKTRKQSYHFSRYGSIWGWATWRRAWQYYDFHLEVWDDNLSRQRFEQIVRDPLHRKHWNAMFSRIRAGEIDTWDIQWSYASIMNGLSIIPSVNLVSNIGYGTDATHTIERNPLSDLPVNSLSFPLRKPVRIAADQEFDRRAFKRAFTRSRSLSMRINNRLKKTANRVFGRHLDL